MIGHKFLSKVRRAKRISKSEGPTEDEIHVRVVARLREAGLGPTDFFHCPNGGKVSKPEAGRRYARGVAAGVPDLVFTMPPPNYPERVGAALELKKIGGRISTAQRAWIAAQQKRGWSCGVVFGEEMAILVLQDWGYL